MPSTGDPCQHQLSTRIYADRPQQGRLGGAIRADVSASVRPKIRAYTYSFGAYLHDRGRAGSILDGHARSEGAERTHLAAGCTARPNGAGLNIMHRDFVDSGPCTYCAAGRAASDLRAQARAAELSRGRDAVTEVGGRLGHPHVVGDYRSEVVPQPSGSGEMDGI